MSLWQTLVASKYPNLASIPGPKPQFPLGNLLDLRGQSARDTSEKLARDFGPYALVWIANQPTVWIHDPDAILDVLSTKANAFFKDEPIQAMTPALGAPNPFTSNGAQWKQTRRDSFLSDARMSTWFEDQFPSSLQFLRDRLQRDLPIVDNTNIESWMYRLVFDLNCQMILGRMVSDRAFAAYNFVMDAADVRMSTSLPILPRHFAREKKIWLDAVASAYAHAQKEPLGVSIAHQMSRFSRLPHHEQVGAIANLFPGGVFSVTATLCHLITQAPALNALKDRVPKSASSYADVAQCIPLEQHVREIFRLTPPIPVFMRRVRENPVQIGPFTLDPKVRVIMGTTPLHRDARHWTDPLSFTPERWTARLREDNPYGSGYLFPFGRGPRACHGQDVALFQINLTLLALLERPASHVQCVDKGTLRFYWGCATPQNLRGTIR